MIDYKKELNQEQYKVVKDGNGACLVLAGAGSGKTRTITYRVAYLLEQGIEPTEILLVTFTNKASREMIQRVEEIVGEKTKLPWGGTFHHIAFKLLRRYAPLLGYNNNFTILDSEDSKDLIKLCLKQEGVNKLQKRFPSAKVLRGIIGYARNAQLSIEQVLEQHHQQWIEFSEIISRVASDYQKRKVEANAMDFDDLLVNLYLLLLKSETTRQKYSEMFKYVLVDEYQDTNKIQASIVNLFASHHKNLLVVGDDAQSIYSFRAADIKNILDFENNYPEAKVFRLETNYRSTPNILDVANSLISNNQSQYKKELKSVRDYFAKPEVHPFADQREEATFIADRILELREEGVALNNMAVLFRAAHLSQALEVELVKRDIPYEYRGGIRFFERAHIKDVLAYLRVFHNTNDTVAWNRALNMQVGIGPATVQKIIAVVRSMSDLSQMEQIKDSLSIRAKVGFNDFLSIWDRMKRQQSTEPAQLIAAVMDSKYAEYLEAEHSDYRQRKQDIEQLALFAENQTDINQFLGEVSLQEGFRAGQVQKNSGPDEEEKLVLSTVHQAKGLEWEAVFVIGVSNGQFPNDRATKQEKGLEEERRLFYVAVTRAKTYLHLTYSLTGGFGSSLQGPSLFIDEIENDLLDHHNFATITSSSVFKDPSDDVDDVTYVAEDDSWNDWGDKKRSFLKRIDDL